MKFELVLVTFPRIPLWHPLKGRWPVLMPLNPTPTCLRCYWCWLFWFCENNVPGKFRHVFYRIDGLRSVFGLSPSTPPSKEGDQCWFISQTPRGDTHMTECSHTHTHTHLSQMLCSTHHNDYVWLCWAESRVCDVRHRELRRQQLDSHGAKTVKSVHAQILFANIQL